jgi:hypothetical protein
MESPTPFDLNEAIRRWQHNLGASLAFNADNLEELASHLRASIQKLKAAGLSEEEAFRTAVRRIGERGVLEREFHKVKPVLNWSLPKSLFWFAAGVFFARVILSLSLAVRSAEWSYNFVPRQPYVRLTLSNSVDVALLSLVVLFLCWRFFTDGGKKFGASFVSRFEGLANARLKLTVLNLLALATVVAFLPSISGVLANRVRSDPMEMGDLRDYWPAIARRLAFNVVLVLTMVFLARRGLRKIPPADGTLHARAMSS